jgi:lysophospholipase L1-like esterase
VSLHGQVVAYLGDDWTVGTGASQKSKRFTTLVSKQLGVTPRNFGVDGTGYAKSTDSTAPNNYDARVDEVAAAHPDTVVVSGGRNDVSDGQSTVESDIKTLFTQLHKKLPDATLIAIEPMWGDSAKPTELAPIAAAVHKDVEAVGGHYIAMPDPIHGHSSWMSDNQADPNDAGYAAIAKALAPKLQAILTQQS